MWLFTGTVMMKEVDGMHTDLQIEHFTEWHDTRDAALGSWITRAMEKWPKRDVASKAIWDITEIARNEPRS
jgi:hypothetical protein